MKTIILYTIIILLIIIIIIVLFYNEDIGSEQEREIEEKEQVYLKLQNMTTNEILLFKKKDDFIKDVGCYDILRNFYNDDEIIKKIYPGYKKV